MSAQAYVLRYNQGSGQAVAVLPVEKTCIFYAGSQILVRYSEGGAGGFVAEGQFKGMPQTGISYTLSVATSETIECLPVAEAVKRADEMREDLVEKSTIVPVAFPPPPKEVKAEKVDMPPRPNG